MATKNTRLTAITLVVTLIIMTIIIVMMVAQGNLVRTEGKPQSTHGVDMVVATTSTIEVTHEPRINSALHGRSSLNTNCAVELAFINNTESDVVISIYVETVTNSDEHEEMIPAKGSFTVTLIRAEPVTFVSAGEASGSSDALVNWAPDYSGCPNGPAVTPPTGGVGDSQQIERPAPSADLNSDLNVA
ncbi:hypothetical protein IPM44_03775 [bacterium]|nr:MAG: hypothetical protein IPM44_03775 [bacterium]